mgnify:FL=1
MMPAAMMLKPKKIFLMPDKKHSINAYTLKWDKRYLQEKCNRLEAEIDARYHYLTEHLGSLAIHSVLPTQGDKVTSVAD